MPYEIRIYGRNNHGPWEIERLDGQELTDRNNINDFGALASKVIDLIQGRKQYYDINYVSSNGLSSHILTEKEEKVLLHIMDSHNRTVKQIFHLEEFL